jgi:hypothetical protein
VALPIDVAAASSSLPLAAISNSVGAASQELSPRCNCSCRDERNLQ